MTNVLHFALPAQPPAKLDITLTRREAKPGKPAAVHATAPLPATGGRRGEYALADIARALHLLHFEVRTIIVKLRDMAKHHGMPLPRTPRLVKGKEKSGPESIYQRSRWDAGEIDAWLDHRDPAGPAAAAARSVPPPIRAEMKERARAVGGR